MNSGEKTYFWHYVTLGIIALGLLILFYAGNRMLVVTNESPTERAIQQKLAKEDESFRDLHFDLADPGQAPAEIRDAVRLGFQIMNQTAKYAKGYAGDKLSCSNCHFGGGNSIGGKKEGIPLAGVAAVYPKYDQRLNRVIDLPARINNCFEKSMNGHALPYDSQEMLALSAYFHWISKDFPIYQNVPWLQRTLIRIERQPDIAKGKEIYFAQCAACHGSDGQGKSTMPPIPPIWGEHSFNDAAGMAELQTLAAFIFVNMPYNNPSLTKEQAFDVAAFIQGQPRPHLETAAATPSPN